MDGGAWRATVHGVAKSQDMTEGLSSYITGEDDSRDFPGGSDGKDSACNAGDPGSIPGSGRSSGEGNGNPLQYFCLENSIDRGAQ